MTTLKTAAQIILDNARTCPLPLALDPGRIKIRYQAHDYFFVADVAMRCFKTRGRWKVTERDIYRVARHLAELSMDNSNLVDVRPQPTPDKGLSFVDRQRDWRGHLMESLEFEGARERLKRPCPCGTSCRRPGLQEDGLPCGMKSESFLAWRRSVVLARTRPFEAMSWSAERHAWRIPRGYAEVLDRWAEQDAQRTREAMQCTACGRDGMEWAPDDFITPWELRVSGTEGWVALCPECSSSRYRPYDGQLRGRRYSRLASFQRADEWLCHLCKEPRRAAYWDHCHGHDMVRGPACASCNNLEGYGLDFALSPGHLAYLLECRECDKGRTLPERHIQGLISDWVRATQRRADCQTEPWSVHGEIDGDGAVRCIAHCCTDHVWEHLVSAEQVSELIGKAIDHALADPASRPSW